MGVSPGDCGPLDGDRTIHCDAVVVGGGPCGVVAALTLAERGLYVVLLEAGPRVTPADMAADASTTLARYFFDGGLRALRSTAPVPTLQARALGGGSVFNSAICMRPPADLAARWDEEYGVRLDGLDGALDWVERFYEVGPVDDAVIGGRSGRFRTGCRELGWSVEALSRMAPGCVGSGRCLTGCRTGAKRSADRRGVPELLAAGGTVCTHVDVARVIARGGRVTGVEGVATDPVTGAPVGRVRVQADVTVLAAGVLASPALQLRGGVDGPGIGTHLQLHPSSFALARFDDDVAPWEGATQGLHSTHHLDRGIKLEDLWAPPGILAARLPRGPVFARALAAMKQMGVWATWVTTGASEGRVRTLPGGAVDMSWEIAPSDLARLQDGIVHLAELSFAAGAREVFHGIEGLPPLRPEDLGRLRDMRLAPRDLDIASNHLFGTLRMGEATDAHGRLTAAEGVVVVDTSLFPDSPGANPMLLGMALARRNALQVAAAR